MQCTCVATLPSISVVTIVLNDREGLIRTGTSLQTQSYSPEWIVVDGGSSDYTLDVLRNYGKEARWTSERDNGIYDAMNKGVTMCNGDYVVFLNSGDCFSDSEVLSDIRSFLSSPKGLPIDVLCCGANLVLTKGEKVYRPPKTVEKYIWHGLPANHQATYYRRVILDTPPYDLRFKICGDYFLAATLYVRKAVFGYFNRPAVEFILDGVSSKWPRALFIEPYTIQKMVLSLGFGWRIVSLLKRLLSGVVLRLFNLPLVGNGLTRMFAYIRLSR